MSASDQPDIPPVASTAPEPMRYRLVVGSAAEAVALVRERFGANARVISVRQLEAGGLKRFLQKPRLEVIVEVGGPEPARLMPSTVSDSENPVEAGLPAGRAGSSDESVGLPLAGSRTDLAENRTKRPSVNDGPTADPSPPVSRSSPVSEVSRSSSILRATGLDEVLLARVRADHPLLDWSSVPAPEALGTLGAWLRRNYDAIPRRPVGARRVFFGSCGVGKTTALCKALALDVFVRGRSVAVLKLDGDQPNASDGLAAFCDVLGAPLLRSAAEVGEFDEDTLLYLDVPGVGLDAPAEHVRLAQTLDALHVDMRVLVVNAACETEVIQDTWELGRACGATHVVFTHGDEVRRPGKLWRFVLHGGLRPLFLCAGPSPAGEVEEDVFSALLARTFPRSLARAAAPLEGGRS